MKKRDNTKRSRVGPKRGEDGKWAKGTPSPNPHGAPKRGQSLKDIAKTIGDMTPTEAADWCSEIANRIKSIGDGVTLKEAVVLRIYTSLLFEPDARLFDAIMNRDEGKVSQPVEVYDWRKDALEIGRDPDDLFTRAVDAAQSATTADHRSNDAGSISGDQGDGETGDQTA